MVIRKVFNVTDGNATAEIQGLEPGSYNIQFDFKKSESDEKSYVTLNKTLNIQKRNVAISLVPNFGESKARISDDGKHGMTLTIESPDGDLDSTKVNGNLKIKFVDGAKSVDVGVINLTDYTNKDSSSSSHTVFKDFLESKWDTILTTLGRNNKFGSYQVQGVFTGAIGFEDTIVEIGVLYYTTTATITNNKAEYVISPSVDAWDQYVLTATITDKLNNPINGVKIAFISRLKGVTQQSPYTLGTTITNNQGVASITVNFKDIVDNGVIDPNKSYEIVVSPNEMVVPYLGDSTPMCTSNLTFILSLLLYINNQNVNTLTGIYNMAQTLTLDYKVSETENTTYDGVCIITITPET